MPDPSAIARSRSTNSWKSSTIVGVDMKAARFLVWLISLVALMMPPGMAAHAMAPAHPATFVDCPDHPSPPPCPDQRTAKHATGDCCPLMVCMAALLPSAASVEGLVAFLLTPPARLQSYAGRTVAKDPPPPRV